MVGEIFFLKRYLQRKSAVKEQFFEKTFIFPASENLDTITFSVQRRISLFNVLDFSYKMLISQNHP